MPRYIDITGQTFGRWSVVALVEQDRRYSDREWLCRCECGTLRRIRTGSLRRGHSKSCGCYRDDVASAIRRGSKHPNWKGGKKIDKNGYVTVLIEPGSNVYVPEHRLVMERHLGRALEPDETVHHKNGIRSDNRLKNLELWVSNHPKGQRAEDIMVWAKQMLRRYAPECLVQ